MDDQEERGGEEEEQVTTSPPLPQTPIVTGQGGQQQERDNYQKTSREIIQVCSIKLKSPISDDDLFEEGKSTSFLRETVTDEGRAFVR